jgi:hypothetical protein
MMVYRRFRYCLIWVFIFLFSLSCSFCQTNGSEKCLSGWANIKTRFKAAGDGIRDDTRAFQLAIDSLSDFYSQFNLDEVTKYFVLYLPKGNYVIRNTLRIEGKLGFSIIGESKESVKITWKGKSNSTILLLNGSTHGRISNISWIVGDIKGMEIIGLHWQDVKKGKYAPTSIEFSNMYFGVGSKYGIYGGTDNTTGTGHNDAEILIKGCVFNRCSTGVHILGRNALDYWIWNSEFLECKEGIKNYGGNYHAYNCYFYKSSISDFVNWDGYYISVRGCKSVGSKKFSFDEGGSCNPFKRIFQGNRIESIQSIPIEFYSVGRITLLNNLFNKSKDKNRWSINYGGWCPSIYQVLSHRNTFEDSLGVKIQSVPNKLFSVRDTNSYRSRTKGVGPVFNKLNSRIWQGPRIFEVSSKDSETRIQSIINEASRLSSENNRHIVHFQAGYYKISKPIYVPARSYIQLIGDGILKSTVIGFQENMKAHSLIHVDGPSQVSIRDMELVPDKLRVPVGISFSNLDQKGSVVRIDQMYTGVDTAIFINGYNYTYFEKTNSFYSSGNVLIGGEKQKEGLGAFKMYCFGAQSAKTLLHNQAVFVGKDCWWEGSSSTEYIPLDFKEGSGNFSISGAMLAPNKNDTSITIRIGNFKGSITLSDMYVHGGMEISSITPDCNLFAWNINFLRKMDPYSHIGVETKSKIFVSGITNECFSFVNPGCVDGTIESNQDIIKNVENLDKFIDFMMEDLTVSLPKAHSKLPAAISQVYLSRISISGGNVAFMFK